MALKFPDKDPDEILDYTVDWSRYLGDLTIDTGGDAVVWKIKDADGVYQTISGSDTVNGLTVNSTTNTTTTATIVLDAGTANTTYTLQCQIRTSVSDKTNAKITTAREINLRVRERS